MMMQMSSSGDSTMLIAAIIMLVGAVIMLAAAGIHIYYVNKLLKGKGCDCPKDMNL